MYVGTALNGRSEGEEGGLLEQDLGTTQIYFTFNTAGDGKWQTRKGRRRKRKCGVVRDTTVVQEKRKFDGSPCSKVMPSRPCKCGFSIQ